MSHFKRQREPVDVEDGVTYYANRRTMRAVRQANRQERRCSRLRRHRPLSRDAHRHAKYARRVEETVIFRKDVKQLRGCGLDLASLEETIRMLAEGGDVPPEYDDHGLKDPLQMHRVCRIDEKYYLVYTPGEKPILRRIWTEATVEHERNG